jgi:hypothetical protein
MTETVELIDDLGGYNPDSSKSKWPCGSIFANEGERLYQLVRQYKPKVIVEVGRYHGCSTSHLALGCKHNGFGRVYSIDIMESAGQMIPRDLRKWISFINTDALTYEFPKRIGKIDMLYEDSSHDPGATSTIFKKFPAPVMACHDFNHRSTVKNVHDEAVAVLGQPTENFFEPPSDCGLGIWIRP